ncbi:MAG: peptidoglycan DD-metalloendopeptidase family protein [Acidobacteria bacterium]|nr:peptidoglycan DD-metalloendopeptidase family protein [Acidobacteriota bacterium]
MRAPAQTPAPTGRARAEVLARRAGERMQALKQEAARLAAEERTLLGDLRQLELDRQIKQQQLRGIEADAADVQAALDATAARIADLARQDLTERPALRARLVEAYKLGRGRYLRMLFSTGDLRRLGQAARAVAVLEQVDRDRIAKHEATLSALRQSRAALEERQRRLAVLRAEAERAQAAAARAVEARAALIRGIDERRDLNAQFAGELQAAQARLQVALRNLQAEPAAAVDGLPLRPFKGDLEWPAAGAVRLPFRRTPAGGTPSNGIEIAAAEGAPVQAVHEGVVAYADTFAGFGNLVILDHGGQAFSLYGNLLDIAVAKGAPVRPGDTLGRVGQAPAGPAGLYFEIRIDGQPVDPLEWLKTR